MRGVGGDGDGVELLRAGDSREGVLLLLILVKRIILVVSRRTLFVLSCVLGPLCLFVVVRLSDSSVRQRGSVRAIYFFLPARCVSFFELP